MNEQRRAARRAPSGSGQTTATNRSHPHCTTWPVALQVWKRSRWVTVAKVVGLDGEPVLAVAVRHQQGSTNVVSVPLAAIHYAELCGATALYRRHDREGSMGRISFEQMRALGWVGVDGEQYVRLADLEPVPWQPWAYVERTERLGEHLDEPEPGPVQLGLLEVAHG